MAIGFDIEVAAILDDFSTWREHRPLGITCAATYDSKEESTRVWHGGERPDGRRCGRMTKDQCKELLEYLAGHAGQGTDIITWNGLGFDFDVLAEESGEWELAAQLAIEHIDVGFAMLCDKGYMIGLNTAALGMRVGAKTQGMSGKDAPKEWKNSRERQDLVLRYVAQDAMLTYQVYDAILADRRMRWTARSGRACWWYCSQGISSVYRALQSKEPDTSWMKGDPYLTRGEMVAWTKPYLSGD